MEFRSFGDAVNFDPGRTSGPAAQDAATGAASRELEELHS